MPSNAPRPALASHAQRRDHGRPVGRTPTRGVPNEPVRRACGRQPEKEPARRGGGRRRAQFDRSAVGRVPVGVDPGVLSRLERGRVSQALGGDQALQRGQPVLVISRAVVGLTARGGGPQFVGQRRGPLRPGEMAALRQRDREGERLRLPRLGEHRSAVVARQRAGPPAARPAAPGQARSRWSSHKSRWTVSRGEAWSPHSSRAVKRTE